MTPLNTRLDILLQLGAYMADKSDAWLAAQEQAALANPWFMPEQIQFAIQNIVRWLQAPDLETWVRRYPIPDRAATVGIVMAGNIPLVGFHDWLCGFVCGHRLRVKPSSKDEILLKHLVAHIAKTHNAAAALTTFEDNLKGCDAYIATGSNNSSRYFESYFGKYPHIIRRNRTAVAILDGSESEEKLALLADDIFIYYGLGCRSVTQVCVPAGYDFSALLAACSRFEDAMMHHKYKNNYDYHLAIYLLNKVPYRTNGSLLMVENDLPFAAVSVLHYRYYDDRQALVADLQARSDVQAIVGEGFVPFGSAQRPTLADYADGVDTMAFLCSIR